MTAQDPCVVQFGILTERTTENNHELNLINLIIKPVGLLFALQERRTY